MTEFATRQDVARVATVAAEAGQPTIRSEIDRGFGLPAGLYAASAAGYFGFLAVMSAAFMNPSLALPMVVIALSLVAGFGVPTLWVRMRPDNAQRAMTYQSFRNRGIETASGHLDGGAAAVQVLILPVLILCWGIAVAVIAALT